MSIPFITDSNLDRGQRLLYGLTGCGLLGLLLIARCLSPSEMGLGTHQKLGLPPCGAIVLFGIPCPTCGMTTSWAHFTRGHFVKAWQCNPGGPCLAIVAMITSVWTWTIAFRGIYQPWFSARVSGLLAAVIAIITTLHWLGKIF